MAVSSTSYTNTPQANDDDYRLLESYFDTNASVLLNVMSNDRGGAAKELYSVDNGDALADLLARDPGMCGAWEKTVMGNEHPGHAEHDLRQHRDRCVDLHPSIRRKRASTGGGPKRWTTPHARDGLRNPA